MQEKIVNYLLLKKKRKNTRQNIEEGFKEIIHLKWG